MSLTSLLLSPAAAETLSLVSGDDYPPFAGTDLTGGGVLTELVQQAFSASGIATSVDFKPWTRGYEESLGLDYDATYPYLGTPQRAVDFLFSDPLYQLNLRLYVRRDSAWHTGSPAELGDATFCLPSGYEVSGWVRRENDRLNFARPRSMQQCHAMLQLGRVDVLISNPDEMAWQAVAPRQIPHNVRQLPEPVDDVTLHLIIPRAHPQARQLIDSFNAGLQQLSRSGARDQLFQQHADYRRSLEAGD